MKTILLAEKLYGLLIKVGNGLQSTLLLALRGYWGWQFFETGKGKLQNLGPTSEYFASLHLPLPYFNAVLAGSTECFGGILLAVGVAARLVSIPLAFTMMVAFYMAERENLLGAFSEPDNFLGAAPLTYLMVALVIFAFGPGAFSVDGVIAWRRKRSGAQAR